MSEKLPKFKPIYTNPNKSVVFDRNLNQLKHRLIIIFHDDFSGEYFYIKARSTYEDGIKKKPYQGEIFVPAANKGLLTKDSYVDTTQIFSIKEEELEQLVGQNKMFLTTNHFTREQITEISISLINNLLRSEEPLVSWIEVKLDDNNEPIPTLKYCHPNYIKEITNKILNKKHILDNLNKDRIILMNLKSLGAEVNENLKDWKHTWEDDYQEEQQESKKLKDEFEMIM
ncbi:Mbov_0400 family ICE element protein [Mycoplasmopsis cricetuli]|uniref:Mbov_0400 family ICE element protein n=1 Tax=Mycoplasmopsis cricetuli TaxID=171283 RepID=UPI0004702C9F|nr:hypothetical protein [Mycoplasmopsis cricetuli]